MELQSLTGLDECRIVGLGSGDLDIPWWFILWVDWASREGSHIDI